MPRLLCALAAGALLGATPAAQQPSLNLVLSRLDGYLLEYEQTLASVVAEERYSQSASVIVRTGEPQIVRHRVLLSDYALARSPVGWAGFRDTFEVDGKPVRDREARLAALMSAGTPESSALARRIAFENSRYNIGEEVAMRNINVPTVAVAARQIRRITSRIRAAVSAGGIRGNADSSRSMRSSLAISILLPPIARLYERCIVP